MLRLDRKLEAPFQSKAFMIMLAVSVALGVAFEWLFGERENGLSVPIFMMAVVSALFLMLQLAGRKPKWAEYWLAVPLMLFSVMIAVRASPALKAINTFAIVFLLILLVWVAVGKKISALGIGDYVLAPFLSIVAVERFVAALKDLEGLRRQRGPSTAALQVLKGALLAAPFLLIFILLLSSADSVFRKLFGDWVESFLRKDAWSRILPALAAAAFFVGLFRIAQRSLASTEADAADRFRKHAPLMAVTFLGLINALFLVFVLIQVKYLFGAETSLRALDLTYADYARHGFFELLAVAGLSFGLLCILEKAVSKKDGRHAPSFKAMGVLHVALVLGIVLSAHVRLNLYEAAYGFTISRFFAHAFVFWLAAVFVLLAANILISAIERRFAFALFVSALVFVGAVNLANPDAFVAARNLERYHETGKIDASYLGYSLSADATPVLAEFFEPRETCMHEGMCTHVPAAQIVLAERQDWRSFNFAKAKTRELLQAKGFSDSKMPALRVPIFTRSPMGE